MRTLPIALLLVSAAAHASTARRIEQVDEDHAKLKIVVTTTKAGLDEVVLPITIPEGMAVTGMSVTIGREPTLFATPLLADSARGIYDRVVRNTRDPALLETLPDGSIRLSVFPVTKRTPARVTIELTAVTEVEGLARLSRGISLVAAPMLSTGHDPYADYWPAHREWREEVVVAVNDPE